MINDFTHPTLSQARAMKPKPKDFYMKRRRAKIGNKKLWQNMFVGSIDIKELYKCYGIKP